MKTLSLDLETYSSVDLGKSSVYLLCTPRHTYDLREGIEGMGA